MLDLNSILEKTGQFVAFKTERNLKVKKGNPIIKKQSSFVGRLGINYDNMQSVKEKRISGELPEENQGLPWGQWVKFPYLITHNGKYYLRITMTKNSNQKPHTQYFLESGEECSKEYAKSVALASEFKDTSDNDVITVYPKV